MKSNDYTVTDVANTEMREFAMYTVSSRAIPNLYDGLKPVQRFYLYSSIVNSPKEFKKVSAISGIISEYGYNHGEASAAGAGQLMAAEWNNNVCLVEGRGGFGTRLVQEAGAPRYVYTRLHSNFSKYMKDLNLAPVHGDPEHAPPQFYIPVIPLVLSNGVSGIAMAFATKIFPRATNDIIAACEEYLKTGKIKKRLPVSFPHFTGTTKYDTAEGKFFCHGVYQKTSSTKMLITEVPFGFDREAYVKVLDKLEADGDIVSYDDQCSKHGFQFEVKLKQQTSAKWDNEKIMKNFKLTKALSENISVIDEKSNLRAYSDERELIADFCNFRLGILRNRISSKIDELNELDRWLTVKIEFINAVLDDDIVFKGKKKDAVAKQILSVTSAIDTDIDRLLRINILSLTKEMVDALKAEIKENTKTLTYWKKTTPKDQFVADLDELQ